MAATQQLGFRALPSVAFGPGAVPGPSPANILITIPNPVYAGSLAWSTVTNGVVVFNGTSWGAVGSSSSSSTVVAIDLGVVPRLEYVADVPDSNAKTTSLVTAQVVGLGAGRDLDELEFDCPEVHAWVVAAGSIRFKFTGLQGPVSDVYRVAYTII